MFSYPYFVKKIHFLKTSVLSCSYFVKKRSFSQKQNALISFFQNFHEEPPAVKPILSQKTSILSKLRYIMGHKSQQNALSFRFFTKKSKLSCPYFVQKSPFSKKYGAPMPYFVKKRSFSKTR